jgi:2-aminoethylphosphonate-pyruvate transaminase
MRAILLNPGPVSLSVGVRKAAMRTDYCHREPEFFDLQDRVRSGLLDIYGNDPGEWSAVLLGGSGTTALEAMLASLLPRAARLLVLENGVYGERITQIAQIHGVEHEVLHHGWLDPWDPGRLEDRLTKGGITHIAAVHHETTTGRLNPIGDLARLCERHDVRLLLDAVSSFGAESLPFDSPALAACAATANKCLHGITGLCMVICRRSDLEGACDPPRSLVLDLALWSGHQDRRSTPFTPSVNSMLALEQALIELEQQGGYRARHARYSRLAGIVARKLAQHGIENLLPEGESSSVLRAYRLPPTLDYEQLHERLKQRGFVIYAGQGKMASGMFRISTMGEISDYDRERLLAALEAVLD